MYGQDKASIESGFGGAPNFDRLRAREAQAMHGERVEARQAQNGQRKLDPEATISELIDRITTSAKGSGSEVFGDLGTLVHKLIEDNATPKPGRETGRLTPERSARMEKMRIELKTVITKNMLEHGVDIKGHDTMLAVTLAELIITLDKRGISPGLSERVGTMLALQVIGAL